MLASLTLDQLRTLEAVVDGGSFSAAGRRLQRVQSAVSTQMQKLEAELGVLLFDRSTKIPTLTTAGHNVLSAARRVLAEVEALGRLTGSLADGLEPQLSLCVDFLFPLPALVTLCAGFAKAFPTVDLRVDIQTLSAVAARVLDGSATLGVTVPVGLPPTLERTALTAIRMVPVVAASHALAKRRGPIPSEALDRCIQIVLAERRESGVPDQAVLSTRTWRVADLQTKHALLVAGLGWGNLPEHLVRDDLRKRRLVEIRPAAWSRDEHVLHLTAIHRRDQLIGPAHRWALEQLGVLCDAATRSGAGRSSRG